MNSPDPVWYDALKGEPLKTATFTKRLADNIRAGALGSPKQRRRAGNRLVLGGVAALGAALIVVAVAYNIAADGLGMAGKRDLHASPSVPSSSVPSPATAGETRQGSSLDEWDDPDVEVLGEFKANDLKYALKAETRSYKEHRSIRLLLEWYENGDKPTGSLSKGVLLEGGKLPSERTVTVGYSSKGIVMYFGMLIDPNIASVRAVERDGSAVHDATIIHGEDGHTYWYIAIPGDNKHDTFAFRLEGLNSAGQTIADETDFNYRF